MLFAISASVLVCSASEDHLPPTKPAIPHIEMALVHLSERRKCAIADLDGLQAAAFAPRSVSQDAREKQKPRRRGRTHTRMARTVHRHHRLPWGGRARDLQPGCGARFQA